MSEERKPTGYLMGLPIYEELPDMGEVQLGELTPDVAQRLIEQCAAGEPLTESKAILLMPQEDVKC